MGLSPSLHGICRVNFLKVGGRRLAPLRWPVLCQHAPHVSVTGLSPHCPAAEGLLRASVKTRWVLMGVCTLGSTSSLHRTLLLLPPDRARPLWPHTSPWGPRAMSSLCVGAGFPLALPASVEGIVYPAPTSGFGVPGPGFPTLSCPLLSVDTGEALYQGQTGSGPSREQFCSMGTSS